MKISLVIPVYNTEQYLRTCLESCLNQNINISEYEIIIVNDGSPDNSIFIAEEYAKRYDNITILTQDNAGLSVARNNGLNLAKGEYVWFIDSDDWIEKDILNGIVSFLTMSHPDILQLQYQLAYEDGRTKAVTPICIEGCQDGKTLLTCSSIPAPAQFCIYRTEFLREHNIFFYPGIYHEDSLFKPIAVFKAKSVCLYNQVVYNYLQRNNGSITSRFKLKNAKDIIIVNQQLFSFYSQQELDKKTKRYFHNTISTNFNTLFLGLRHLDKSEKEVVIQILKENRELLKLMLRTSRVKYICEGILFNINIRLGLFFHKCLKQ